MNTRKKLEIKKLATAFFLAAFVFLASSSSALAASRDGNVTSNIVDKVEEAVYSDSSSVKSSNSMDVRGSNAKANAKASTNDEFISDSKRDKLLDPAQIPAVKQPAIDRSNPDNKLLEKAAKAFDNAENLAP